MGVKPYPPIPEVSMDMSQPEWSPEEMQQLAGLATGGEEGNLYEQQMARAMALRRAPQAHTTGLGGALGGLGDALNSGVSGYEQSQTGQQQQALLGRNRAGTQMGMQKVLADIMRRKRVQPVVEDLPPDIEPSSPIGPG